QLLAESLLLSTVGSALGIGISIVVVKWLLSVLPPGIPRTEEISVNGAVLLFTAAVALATGLLFGIVPALRATSPGQRSTAAGAGRGTSRGAQHHRTSAVLVAAEVAFAVLLVVAATLLVRSFTALRSVRLGFRPDHVIAARVTPPNGSYRD